MAGITPSAGKLVSLDRLALELAARRRAGASVALCHGVFDLLHIGHVRHLQQARAMADFLAVTVTPDRYVNKGPGRPAFTETLRAEVLVALAAVDFVAINDWPTAVEAIGLLRPNFFVKGPDYRDPGRDATGGIVLEERAITAVGGRLVITEGLTSSSSRLLNRYFWPLV